MSKAIIKDVVDLVNTAVVFLLLPAVLKLLNNVRVQYLKKQLTQSTASLHAHYFIWKTDSLYPSKLRASYLSVLHHIPY